MYVNKGKIDNLLERCEDGSYKDNYSAYLKEVRNEYSAMLGRSKTLMDVIIYNERVGTLFDMRSKLLVTDMANLLMSGEECEFGKYLLSEPHSVKSHTLSITKPGNFKNYTNAKFELNYLINKIGLKEVVIMLGALSKVS